MGAFTDFIVTEGTKIYALVELDDYATTKSTGGVVQKVYWILPGQANQTPWNDDYDMDSNNYKTIEVTNHEDFVKKGFILQDKTNVLRDPNS